MANYINPPRLPASIQGDGKNFVNLVGKFMTEVSDYINVATGTSDNVEVPSNTNIATPQQFQLSFDKSGGKFTWNKVTDDTFEFYEIRLDDNPGDPINAIATTTDNFDVILPLARAGKVYLYAKGSKGYSNPNILNYNKAVPKSPEDISMSKTPEGTLIYFSPIPDNCIGCHIYVNGGSNYTTTSNVFLYNGSSKISTLKLMYYDTFGEGEASVVTLRPLEVTGFDVYKNGNMLNFVWDAINLYGIHYIVRRGESWEFSEPVCDVTGTNYKHIFPNTGSHIFWIKAVDEHDNESENASWCTVDVAQDLNRNVVLNVDEKLRGYPGAKINVSYESQNDAIELDPMVVRGEYVVDVELPQKYIARNWIDYSVAGVSTFAVTWDDMDFTWDSEEAQTTWIGDISNTGISIKHQISRFSTLPSNIIEGFEMDDSLVGIKGKTPTESTGATYQDSRFQSGLLVKDSTRVSWTMDIPSVFSLTFVCKLVDGLKDSVIIATLSGVDGKLFLGYNKVTNTFYLSDNLGNTISTQAVFRNSDYISFGISQSNTTRKLFVNEFVMNDTKSVSAELTPISSFGNLYLYPKF